EPVFLEVEFLVHLDSRHAEEGREVGRHRVGQIDHRGKAARGRRARGLRRNCRGAEGGRERPLEETAPRKRVPYRFLTSGNAHAEPPSWRPLQSARRKIGAADDDTQPAAKEGCGRLRHAARSDPRADVTRTITKAKGGSKRAQLSRQAANTGNQPSRSGTDASGRLLMHQ